MKFTKSDLRNERQWRASLGINKNQFELLLKSFSNEYYNKYGSILNDRKVKVNIDYCINSEEDLLLFTLFSLKSGLTYDVLGLVCGMDGSNAKRNQEIGLHILKESLISFGHYPKRKFDNVNEFKTYFSKIDTLLIDATEQRIQRPSDNDIQGKYFSGKKKAHTLKSTIISSVLKEIMFLSYSRIGSLHDYKFLKYEFSPCYKWFENFNVKVDLGYLGIMKDYVCKNISIPNKKPIKKELTESQKNENKIMASERIYVENSIAGLKRYRILSDRLRIHDIDLYDEILGVCAGLWNFNLCN